MRSKSKIIALTEAQSFVNNIADAMADVPAEIDLEYEKVCSRAAANLGAPVEFSIENVSSLETSTKQSSDKVLPWGRAASPRFVSGQVGSLISVRNAAMAARNNVFEQIDRVYAFISKAKNAGFSPRDNPFAVIAELNERKQRATASQAQQLAEDIKKYVELLKAEKLGQFDVEQQAENSTQLSSVTISLDGLGGSGNTALDLMSFVPDMDAIRKQKAKDALAVIDFRKRVPKILFTADYAPDGSSRGCIVGWKKIPDASGYILKRRNIFDGSEQATTITNEVALDQHARFEQYVKTWVMSFYDDVGIDSVYYVLDPGVPENGYYTYTLQAYQTLQDSKNTFLTETGPANLSQQVRRQLRQKMDSADPGDGDSISPYPILAQALLGDPKLDWVLAAVNTRASIMRNDLRSYTRKFGYLNAQLDFLFSAMDEGKFVIPKDPQKIISNVSRSIALFGVTQVILESLQETGVLYHFDGTDARDQSTAHIQPTVDSSGILATVVSAVDPETMTLDLRALAANLPVLLDGGTVRSTTKLSDGILSQKKAEEIEISVSEEDRVQFAQELEGTRAGAVDLTTFEGLGKLIRTVRVFADTRGTRASPNSSVRT